MTVDLAAALAQPARLQDAGPESDSLLHVHARHGGLNLAVALDGHSLTLGNLWRLWPRCGASVQEQEQMWDIILYQAEG